MSGKICHSPFKNVKRQPTLIISFSQHYDSRNPYSVILYLRSWLWRLWQNSPFAFSCISKFHDCKVFSKLDLKQRYLQLVLHSESRAVATIRTPWGNTRPKRLIFGAKSSQDLFDKAMFRGFGDILNYKLLKSTR